MTTSAENLAAADQPAQAPVQSEEQIASRERLRLLLRTPTFIAGAMILGLWILSGLFGDVVAPHSPFQDNLLDKLAALSGETSSRAYSSERATSSSSLPSPHWSGPRSVRPSGSPRDTFGVLSRKS
jgi:hypothetical protein